jgi:hypothetical protein
MRSSSGSPTSSTRSWSAKTIDASASGLFAARPARGPEPTKQGLARSILVHAA